MIPRIPYDTWMAGRLGLEKLTREDLCAHQLERLNRTLVRAKALSPFYSRHLANITRFPLQSLEEVADLPFTTPQDVRERGLSMLCVGQGEISRVVTLSTSGTTGEPKQLQFTGDDQDLTLGIFQSSMEQVARPGEACFVLLPCATPGGVGDLLCTAIRKLGAHPIAHGAIANLKETALCMAEEESCTLVGIPAQVLALARYCKARGIDVHVRSALLCTDYVSRAVASTLYDIWNCPVFEYYGMTEACYAGGMECAAHDGCHMHETDLLVEIVDPESGRVLPDGEEGEVVITSLLRRGMPLIRYRTGDISRILPEPCPCGSVLIRLEKIRRRKHCLLFLGERELSFSMADLDEALIPLPWLGKFGAELVQDGQGATLELSLGYFGNRDLSAMQEEVHAALCSISKIYKALEEGLLREKMTFEAMGDTISPSAAKRTIRVVTR